MILKQYQSSIIAANTIILSYSKQSTFLSLSIMTINQCPVSIVINPPDIQTCSPLALQLPPNYGVDYRINCRTHRHKWPSGNQWVGGYCGKLIHSNIKSIWKFNTMGSYSSQAKVNHSILVQNKVVCNKCTSEHWHDFMGQNNSRSYGFFWR